jgi:hydroxymethylbilane synthase
VLDLRGNLNTRLAKLDSGQYEAILLAAAGVLRLGWRERISEWLDPAAWLPAVGQGALAVVTRADDAELIERLRPLHDPATGACVEAERAFLRALEGGCQVPIAALAVLDGERLVLDGLVAGLEGETVLRASQESDPAGAGELGRALARRLVERGAAELLEEIRRASAAPEPPSP